MTPRVAILMMREWATKRPKSKRKLKVSVTLLRILGLSACIWQLVIVCGSDIESCFLLGTDGVPVRNAADSSPAEKKFSGDKPDSLLNENELVGNGKATKVDNQRADSVKSRLIPLTLLYFVFFSSAFAFISVF